MDIHLGTMVSRAKCGGSHDGSSPSTKGLLQIGQSISGFSNLLGTRSSSVHRTHQPPISLIAPPSKIRCGPFRTGDPQSATEPNSPSKNPCDTPFTSLGGASASLIKLSIIPSSTPSPLLYCRMRENASASVLKVADTSDGIGMACSLEVLVVSTCSRVEKKVERSGRRGVDSLVEGFGTLCSTWGGLVGVKS